MFILPVDADSIRQAVKIFAATSVKVRDALHAAVALHFGITKIISADRHFDLIQGITRIDPMTFSI